ncbi:hemerythrin domain-containing protein [Streptomyces sp. NPDC002587]
MDSNVLLRDDHEPVEELFKRFEKTGDDDATELRAIVGEVIEELTAYACIEEHTFYPAARFKAKLSVLRANVRHLVEEEEQEWFPEARNAARKAVERKRLTELGDHLEAEKNKAPRDPRAVPGAAGK